MIRLNKVCKRHGNTDLVLNCSLTIESGQAVCLCGPSGIGKTTLLEIMAGLTPPDSGTVRLDSKRVGCAFQDDILVPWLNALDNLLLVLPKDTPNPESASLKWLERFDLDPRMRPTRMSGGMRRRLSLARAFAVNPRILLLDEPFAFLDPAWQSAVAECAERHRAAGNAVLLVSHQLQHMEAIDCRTITVTRGPIGDLREAHAPPAPA